MLNEIFIEKTSKDFKSLVEYEHACLDHSQIKWNLHIIDQHAWMGSNIGSTITNAHIGHR